MLKKLLILGAGVYQVPLILKAKEMGLYTIAASYAGPYPGLAIADEVWEIDTTDYHHLLQKAQAARISGVCTTGTDVSVISVGYLCEKLHLQGIPFSAASLATNKASMKEAFLAKDVATPKACKVFTDEEALDAFSRLQPPVIVKAVDSSGSRGIQRADTKEQVLAARQDAMRVTRKDYVLVEQFITAHEIGVDGLISNGHIQLLLPHDKFTYTTGSTTLPEGHHFPYQCSKHLQKQITEEITRAVHALGLDNCAFNADVLVTSDDVYILEMGGRAGATCIPELISLHTGMDYYAALIRMALGEKITCPSSGIQAKPCMARLLFSKKEGILTSIDQNRLEHLAQSGALISLDYQIGETVPAIQNGTSRIGQVIALTDDIHQMDSLMSDVRHTIKIDGVDLETLWNS